MSESREQAQERIYQWASKYADRFTAPYGILTGKHDKYLSVAFGIARALDVEVRIYSPRWLLLRSSISGAHKFQSVDELLADMEIRFA